MSPLLLTIVCSPGHPAVCETGGARSTPAPTRRALPPAPRRNVSGRPWSRALRWLAGRVGRSRGRSAS